MIISHLVKWKILEIDFRGYKGTFVTEISKIPGVHVFSCWDVHHTALVTI